jgi:hypothetical protein
MKILRRIRDSYEDYLINRTNHRHYDQYSKWLEEYFSLSEEDHTNIITKLERSQTASIIHAMRRKDREIFLNQLGCFYIKQTTIDFYDALHRLIGDKKEGEYDFVELKRCALEECRDKFIKRANFKKAAKGEVKLEIK